MSQITDEELTRVIFGRDTPEFYRAREAELAGDHETFDRMVVAAIMRDGLARGRSMDDVREELVGIGFKHACVREIAHTAEEPVH